MSDTEMMPPYEDLATNDAAPPPSSTVAEFIALSRDGRGHATAALGGTCAHAVEATRQSLASRLCKDINEAPEWGNRPLFRQEKRACTNLQISKFVITDLEGKVLRDEQGPEDSSFTLEAAARRLIVSGTFTKPSAEEVDSPGGDGYTRTKITYAHKAHGFWWTFPRDSITDVGMTTRWSKSATGSITASRDPRILLVTCLAIVSLFAVAGALIVTKAAWVAVVLVACGVGYCGFWMWSEKLDTGESPVSEEKTDEKVIQISGVYPVTLSPVRMDFTIKCDEHIGNILDFVEAVTPETTPVTSRVPLSQVSGSEARVADVMVA